MDLLPWSARRSVAILAFSIGLLPLFGCTGSDSVVEPISARTIETTTARAWRSGEFELVRQFELPPTCGDWQLVAESQRLIDAPGEPTPTRAFMLVSPHEKSVDIPLPADLGEFNRVSLKLVSKITTSVSAALIADGEELCSTLRSTVMGRRYEQALNIDFPTARTARAKPDVLRLSFAGSSRAVVCWDFAVWFRPWESWAADASKPGYRPVLDNLARRGSVISTDNSHSASFEVDAEALLEFSYGIDERLSSHESASKLTLRLTSGAHESVFEYDVPHARGEAARWTTERIDLTDFAGRQVRTELSLASDAPSVQYGFISPLTVFRARQNPRTVLFVTSDTHRADHVAANQGSVDVRTPTLDALAARGVIFDDCYSTTNITVPSHIAMFTATLPRDTLVLDNVSGIAEHARTLAEAFQEAGFSTIAAVSGSQLQHVWSGLGQGFDVMACPSARTWDGRLTSETLASLMQATEQRDSFVWLHLFDAHRPYDADNEFLTEYWPAERDPFDAALPEPEFPRGALPVNLAELRDRGYLDAGYKSEVTYVDDVLARVFEHARFRDGIVAVTADHGECLGEYEIWWDHAGIYPQTLHVPLILAGPGVPIGRRVTGPVSNIDVGRTLLDLAKLETTPFPGESLLVHVEREPARDIPRFALAAHAMAAGVQMEDWYCVLNLTGWKIPGQPQRKQLHSVELYHLANGSDPLRDVSDDEVRRASQMRGLILDWLSAQQITGWVEHDQVNDAARIDQVQALGYTAQSSDGSSMWIDEDCACEFCVKFARD